MAVSLLYLPAWLKPHLFINKNFADLTETDVSDLKTRISKLQEEVP